MSQQQGFMLTLQFDGGSQEPPRTGPNSADPRTVGTSASPIVRAARTRKRRRLQATRRVHRPLSALKCLGLNSSSRPVRLRFGYILELHGVDPNRYSTSALLGTCRSAVSKCLRASIGFFLRKASKAFPASLCTLGLRVLSPTSDAASSASPIGCNSILTVASSTPVVTSTRFSARWYPGAITSTRLN